MSASVQARPFAVVTGASSGIGFALAHQFAINGYDLLIAAEDPGIATAARILMEENPTTVKPVRVDLSTYDGVDELYSAVRETARPIDALVLNAGVGHGADFTATVHLAKRILPDMVERGEGRVLITSWVAATMPGSFQAVHEASKAFVGSFSEAIRDELKDTGVTVTALTPDATDTGSLHRTGMEDAGAIYDPARVAEDGFRAMMAGSVDGLQITR
jgi:short-subunit dehydrogenase